jgi:hypothetical protein
MVMILLFIGIGKALFDMAYTGYNYSMPEVTFASTLEYEDLNETIMHYYYKRIE